MKELKDIKELKVKEIKQIIRNIDYKEIVSIALKALKRYKYEIIFVIVLAFSYSIYRSYSHRTYTCTTTILPLKQTKRLTLMEDQSMISSLLGNSSSRKTTLEILIESRSLAERVVKRLDLLPILYKKYWNPEKKSWGKKWRVFGDNFEPSIEEGAMMLRGMVNSTKQSSKSQNFFNRNQNSTMMITVRNKDQNLAIKIAKAYTEELSNFINEIDAMNVSHTINFLSERIKVISKEVNRLNKNLMVFAEGRDVIEISDDMSALLSKASDIVSEIAAKSIQLQTFNNYKVKNKDSNIISGIEADIKSLETKYEKLFESYKFDDKNTSFIPMSKIPILDFEYRKIEFEYSVQKEIAQMLQKEYEMAKIDQNKVQTPFIILDEPIKLKQTFTKQTFWSIYYQTKYYLKKFFFYLLIYAIIREVLKYRRTKKNSNTAKT
ncbi:MAG: hypothetical protein ABIA04_10540 [Pseudomonadota bacterium]